MKRSRVCVDANLLIALVLKEGASESVRALYGGWVAERADILAPYLIAFECTSVLRNKVARQIITMEEGEAALDTLLRAPVNMVATPDMHRHAWRLATRFNRPTAYDSHYLAVAAHLGVPLYTVDRRLYNAVKASFPLIRFLAPA